MKPLGHAEVRRVAQVTYRQLDYWARTGLLVPSVLEANGSGTKRLYSRTDALAAFALGRLAAVGVAPGTLLANRVVDAVRERGVLTGEVREGFIGIDLDVLADHFLAGAR